VSRETFEDKDDIVMISLDEGLDGIAHLWHLTMRGAKPQQEYLLDLLKDDMMVLYSNQKYYRKERT
jgi:hypothetical protein